MAIGKKAKDIWQSTTKTPKVGLEVAPRNMNRGRPSGPDYEKVTVCLYPKHVIFLDKVALAVRERAGKPVRRAELIRALLDQVAGRLDPAGADFDKAIRALIPDILKGI